MAHPEVDPSTLTIPQRLAQAERERLAAAQRTLASAGGAARDALPSFGGLADAARAGLDEFHDQEERFQTFVRWATVAGVVLGVVIIVAILAWFFAPARGLIGKVAS